MSPVLALSASHRNAERPAWLTHRADRTAVLDNDSRYAKVGAIAREKVAIRTDRWIAENNP